MQNNDKTEQNTRQTGRGLIFGALFLLLLLFTHTPGALASVSVVLDNDFCSDYGSGTGWSQSFTIPAGVTSITRMAVEQWGGTSALNVTLYDGAGTGGANLYTGDTTIFDGNWSIAVFPSAITVTPGQVMSLGVNGYLNWCRNPGDVYPGGGPQGGWPYFDFGMRLYDGTDVVPCTDFTYTDWGACTASSTQSRSILTRSPADCVDSTSTTTQSCTYVTPPYYYLDDKTPGIFSVLIAFIELLYIKLWPFILVIVIVAGFTAGLQKLFKKVIK